MAVQKLQNNQIVDGDNQHCVLEAYSSANLLTQLYLVITLKTTV